MCICKYNYIYTTIDLSHIRGMTNELTNTMIIVHTSIMISMVNVGNIQFH